MYTSGNRQDSSSSSSTRLVDSDSFKRSNLSLVSQSQDSNLSTISKGNRSNISISTQEEWTTRHKTTTILPCIRRRHNLRLARDFNANIRCRHCLNRHLSNSRHNCSSTKGIRRLSIYRTLAQRRPERLLAHAAAITHLPLLLLTTRDFDSRTRRLVLTVVSLNTTNLMTPPPCFKRRIPLVSYLTHTVSRVSLLLCMRLSIIDNSMQGNLARRRI